MGASNAGKRKVTPASRGGIWRPTRAPLFAVEGYVTGLLFQNKGATRSTSGFSVDAEAIEHLREGLRYPLSSTQTLVSSSTSAEETNMRSSAKKTARLNGSGESKRYGAIAEVTSSPMPSLWQKRINF